MVEAGMPRIASRIFVALVATDSGRLTAAELAEQLPASPAAISGGARSRPDRGSQRAPFRPQPVADRADRVGGPLAYGGQRRGEALQGPALGVDAEERGHQPADRHQPGTDQVPDEQRRRVLALAD